MTGWIKWQKGLVTKPEVMRMADLLKMDPHEVAGRLMRVWEWADEQTENGNAPVTDVTRIDALHGAQKFAKAMEEVGWLNVTEHGICFPNFDRHNAQPSKTRALTAKRMTRYRRRKRDAGVTPVTMLEKRREENIYKDPKGSLSETIPPCPEKAIMAFWNTHRISGPKIRTICGRRQKALLARWGEEAFRRDWQEAIKKLEASDFASGRKVVRGRTWLAKFDWLLANPLNWQKVMEGEYDNEDTQKEREPAVDPNAKYRDL
jgi:hypothetical protein